MLALDQRVSLRNIFVDAGLESTEAAIDEFRTAVASTLAPDRVGDPPGPWLRVPRASSRVRGSAAAR